MIIKFNADAVRPTASVVRGSGGAWGGKGSASQLGPPSRPERNRNHGINFTGCEFRDEFFVNFYTFYGYNLAPGCVMRDIRKGAALGVSGAPPYQPPPARR